jgi:serine/threonine-protein kinase
MGSGIVPGLRLSPHLTLVQAVGQGAMGKVWLAEDTRHGRVAVKFLAYGRQKDPTSVARFNREFATASTIDSPHVIRMIEYGVMEGDVPFIVMELVQGQTLEDRLEGDEALSLPEIVAVLRQVGHALDAAHVRGIVHRDVKPENILLQANHGGIHVKVLDFGLAKPWLRHTLTGSGVAMGTPDYMSPEQVLGGKHVDHRADLWALAVIAYRLLCGDFPFLADSVHALMFMICRGTFARPSSFGAPPAFDEWFERAFNKDIAQRFGSAAEMLDALEQAVSTLDEEQQMTIRARAATHALTSGVSDDGMTRVRRPSPAVPSDAKTRPLQRPSEVNELARYEVFGVSDDEKTSLLVPRRDSKRGGRAAPSDRAHASERAPASQRPREDPRNSVSGAPTRERPRPRMPDKRGEEAGIGPMLALIVSAMAIGFGVAAAWKNGLFDRWLAWRHRAPAPAAAPPATTASSSAEAETTATPTTNESPAASGAPDENAFLTVHCRPVCQVWVGNQALGLSPIDRAPVPSGRHRVVVYRDPVGSKVLMVDLEPGEHESYDVTMRDPIGQPTPAEPADAPPSATPAPPP